MPPGGSTRAAPLTRPTAASHGAMWIMLKQRTTSAPAMGQGCAVASSASAGRMFGRPEAAVQASMLARAARVRVARLKHDLRPACAGKVHGVLARAARHLEHQARAGK